MPKVVFTSANETYSPKIFALAYSLKLQNPLIPFFLFTYDEFDESIYKQGLDLIDGVFRVRDYFPMFGTEWINTFNVVEQHCVQKPFAFEILQKMGFDEIIYLDPDIIVYGSLESIFLELQSHDIILTPHITHPINVEGNLWYSELSALKHGTYNLGFIAVNMQKSNAQHFITWWQNRCVNYCRIDFSNGLFTDQKLIDLVPGLFEKVKILRILGVNVASWNLHANVPIKKVGSRYYCKEFELVFFHFSGFSNGSLDHIIEKDFNNEEVLKIILQDYRNLTKSFDRFVDLKRINSHNMSKSVLVKERNIGVLIKSFLLRLLNRLV